MKIYKKSCAILIAIIYMLTIICPTVMAIDMGSIKYLALGDSIAYGYGLADINTQSYAQIVRQKSNIEKNNFKNLAVVDMTCAEFYDAIQTTEYSNAIKEANLITVSIGSNELLKIAKEAVSNVTGIDKDDEDFANKVVAYFTNLNDFEKLSKAYQLYSFFTSEETRQVIDESIETYSDKWKKSVDYIRSLNSDVILIATQFYNPYYEVGLGTYDLGSYADEFIKRMNNILENQSENETRYRIARIYDDFNTTDPRLTNVNVDFNDFSKFNIDPHPNKNGHSIIATRVLDVLQTIEIDQKKDIKELTIEEINDYNYTGSEIKPKVTIKNGDTILKENTDYTVTYINNTEIGKASLIIKGIGDYEGTVIKTFNIKSVENNNIIDINELTVSDIENQIYMGLKITPDVEIKKSDNSKLYRNTDYTLRYYDNIDVGTASIEITGVGNYTGNKKVNFKIVPKDISSAVIKDIDEQEYTADKITPKVQITDGSAELVENKDYELTYRDNIEIGIATVDIKGIGNYTGNASKQFSILEEKQETDLTNINDLSISDIDDKTYTGKVITPEVIIKDGEKTLIKDIDYELSFDNNMNVGTGTVIITGKGDYTNSANKTFNIVRKDIKFTQIMDIKDQIYTGKEITPEIVITSDSIKLKKDQDYTVQYSNNKEEGTAIVTITGINNYTGQTVKTFNISAQKKATDTETNTINTIEQDKTTSSKILPYTGAIKIMFIIIVLVFNGGIFYLKYYKNKDII